MEVAVLSGKGGTGKTTVATNLARMLGWNYADCDVEEPNGFLFLKPEITLSETVTVKSPQIDGSLCVSCQRCVQSCQFNALAYAGQRIMLFSKLCHGCGACMYSCQTGAIKEVPRPVGHVDIGSSAGLRLVQGVLDIGEPMAGPVISKVKQMLNEGDWLVDCSPGSSCNVVKAIDGADFALLVTEPTPFGLHDLDIAARLAEQMGIPHAVIINRSDSMDGIIHRYCQDNDISVVGSIPFSRKAALLYSQGNMLLDDSEYAAVFERLGSALKEAIKCS